MKNFLYKNSFLFLLSTLFIFTACNNDENELGNLTPPSNIQVEINRMGEDANNPYGDGSGEVTVDILADNAFNYRVIQNGEVVNAPNGTANLIFSELGVNIYDLTAVAYGVGGLTDSLDFSVEVLATYLPPQDLVDKLVGDGSRTWRVKAEAQGHFGLGPVGGNIPVEWYGAGPFDKEDTGMYDDRFTFNADGTYTHITNGTIFGRVGLIEEIASGGEIDGADMYNAPYDDYTSTWTLIAPGGVETIKLAGTSFIGYYTGGNHQYQIFDRSVENEIIIKTTDGNGEFDWWFVLTTE